MIIKQLLVIPFWLFLCATAYAHHSRSEFTGDITELTGVLIDVTWGNPHPSFLVRLDDADNSEITIEAYGSIRTLKETGVDASMFVEGSHITFAGQASNRRKLFLGISALLPTGQEAVLQYNGEPHWKNQAIGGKGSVLLDTSQLAKAKSENRGFFRIWNTESTEIAVSDLVKTIVGTKYTDAALAATENWNLTDNPITRCEPSWMPFTMTAPVDLELIDNGDTLTLNNASFSSMRTIYMEGKARIPEQAPSRLGTSVGHWEGSTLVIETTGIVAPAFTSNGAMQSEQMAVVEHLTLSEDQSRLDYEMVMTDPVALKEPAVYSTYYLAKGDPLQGDLAGENCDVSRYIPE